MPKSITQLENERLHRRVNGLEEFIHARGAYDVKIGSAERKRMFAKDAKRLAKDDDEPEEMPKNVACLAWCVDHMRDEAIDQLIEMLGAREGAQDDDDPLGKPRAADEPPNFSGMPRTGGSMSPIARNQNANINARKGSDPAQDAGSLVFDEIVNEYNSRVRVDPYRQPAPSRTGGTGWDDFADRYPDTSRIRVI